MMRNPRTSSTDAVISSPLYEAEAKLLLAEGEMRAAVRAAFPLGTKVLIKAGRGHTKGTVWGYAGPEQNARQILCLRNNRAMAERRRTTFWEHYRNLIIVQ